MRYKQLGRTGVQVSVVSLGTATLGVAPLEKDADRLIGRAFDLGINVIDMANSYGNQARFDRPGVPAWNERPSAEEIVGRVLGDRRPDLILCSKVMEPVGEGVSELRMFFGSGYRVYFGEQDNAIDVLLSGGDKGSQSKDIEQAKIFWKEYLSHE